jgi:sugar phosphate permease
VILGRLTFKMKQVPIQVFVGTIIQTLFLGLYALATSNAHSIASAFQSFVNIPLAWLTLLSNVTATLHVPQKDLGLASGLSGTFRNLGGSIGTAVLSTLRKPMSGPGSFGSYPWPMETHYTWPMVESYANVG